MSIALLCPTRRRTKLCERMVNSADKTADSYQTYLAFDAKERGEYVDIIANKTCLPDGMPTSHKWNELANLAMGNAANNLFMLAADDMMFATPGWDTALLEHYNALTNKIHVYALQDSRDVDGTPHIIVTREWIEVMGWFVPPIFLHWHIDSWTVEIAKSAGVFTHLRDYLLIHDKPSDTGKPDETHTGIRAMGWRDRDQYVADTCRDWLELQKEKLDTIIGLRKLAA